MKKSLAVIAYFVFCASIFCAQQQDWTNNKGMVSIFSFRGENDPNHPWKNASFSIKCVGSFNARKKKLLPEGMLNKDNIVKGLDMGIWRIDDLDNLKNDYFVKFEIQRMPDPGSTKTWPKSELYWTSKRYSDTHIKDLEGWELIPGSSQTEYYQVEKGKKVLYPCFFMTNLPMADFGYEFGTIKLIEEKTDVWCINRYDIEIYPSGEAHTIDKEKQLFMKKMKDLQDQRRAASLEIYQLRVKLIKEQPDLHTLQRSIMDMHKSMAIELNGNEQMKKILLKAQKIDDQITELIKQNEKKKTEPENTDEKQGQNE